MTPRQSIHPSVLAVTMLIMKAMVTVICSPTSPSLFHVLSMLTEPKGRRPIMIVTNALYAEIDRLRARVRELEAALTEERQRTRLSEAIIRENEELTKENMRLSTEADKDLADCEFLRMKIAELEESCAAWKRIAIEAKATIEDLLRDMRENGVAE